MKTDPLDDLVRAALPPVEVTPERVDRLIGAVMLRLDRQPRSVGWLAMLLPVSRFALPMAAAAALGMLVGTDLNQPEPLSLFSTTFLSTTFSPEGS